MGAPTPTPWINDAEGDAAAGDVSGGPMGAPSSLPVDAGMATVAARASGRRDRGGGARELCAVPAVASEVSSSRPARTWPNNGFVTVGSASASPVVHGGGASTVMRTTAVVRGVTGSRRAMRLWRAPRGARKADFVAGRRTRAAKHARAAHAKTAKMTTPPAHATTGVAAVGNPIASCVEFVPAVDGARVTFGSSDRTVVAAEDVCVDTPVGARLSATDADEALEGDDADTDPVAEAVTGADGDDTIDDAMRVPVTGGVSCDDGDDADAADHDTNVDVVGKLDVDASALELVTGAVGESVTTGVGVGAGRDGDGDGDGVSTSGDIDSPAVNGTGTVAEAEGVAVVDGVADNRVVTDAADVVVPVAAEALVANVDVVATDADAADIVATIAAGVEEADTVGETSDATDVDVTDVVDDVDADAADVTLAV